METPPFNSVDLPLLLQCCMIPSKAASHVFDSQLIIPNLTWANNNYVGNEPIQLYEQLVQHVYIYS